MLLCAALLPDEGTVSVTAGGKKGSGTSNPESFCNN